MRRFGIALAVALCTLAAVEICGAVTTTSSTTASTKKKKKKAVAKASSTKAATTPKAAALKSSTTPRTSQFVPVRSKRPVRIASSPWTSPTFADSTMGDNVEGEDLVVGRAAVEIGRAHV